MFPTASSHGAPLGAVHHPQQQLFTYSSPQQQQQQQQQYVLVRYATGPQPLPSTPPQPHQQHQQQQQQQHIGLPTSPMTAPPTPLSITNFTSSQCFLLHPQQTTASPSSSSSGMWLSQGIGGIAAPPPPPYDPPISRRTSADSLVAIPTHHHHHHQQQQQYSHSFHQHHWRAEQQQQQQRELGLFRFKMLPPPLTFGDFREVWAMNEGAVSDDDDDDDGDDGCRAAAAAAAVVMATAGEGGDATNDDKDVDADMLEMYHELLSRWHVHIRAIADRPEVRARLRLAEGECCPAFDTTATATASGKDAVAERLQRWSDMCAAWCAEVNARTTHDGVSDDDDDDDDDYGEAADSYTSIDGAHASSASGARAS